MGIQIGGAIACLISQSNETYRVTTHKVKAILANFTNAQKRVYLEVELAAVIDWLCHCNLLSEVMDH